MTDPNPHAPSDLPDPSTDRRTLFSHVVMGGGLVAGYGVFAAIAGRFLYPANPPEQRWLYVARVADVPPGESLRYTAPSGARINIARQGDSGTADDFVALSSTCPHLGCQVHWEGHNNRFFCPCHNGVFDPAGVATGGPPAEAGQSLASYPLRIENGLLYIQAPTERLARADDIDDQAPRGPGHDPCLSVRVRREA